MKFAPSSTAIRRAIFLRPFGALSGADSVLKNQCLFSLHCSYAQSGNLIPWRDTVPAVSDICASGFIRRYFPSQWAISNSGGWLPLHGSCTPPRISPSCPHYVPLWLDRCTIIGWQGHRKTACHGCFQLDGAARHLIGPSLYSRAVQVVFAHPPNRFPSSGSAN